MLITYVPLTTRNRDSRYEVEIPDLHFLNKKTYANVQGLGSLPNVRLERKIGELPIAVMQEVKKAIIFALNLAK
jgi:mRNA interferase MazF